MHRQTTAYVTANAMMILANAHYNCLPEWLISPILAFGIMLGGLVVMPHLVFAVGVVFVVGVLFGVR